MERDLQEDAKVAIDGGGGGHTPSQEKCGQNCQTSRFINKLASSDALRHYLSRGLQNSFLGSYLAQILRVSWKKAFFFKELGQLLSKFVALFFSLAAAITIILNFTSYAVANVYCYAKSLRIIQLSAFFLISSLKKVLCNRLICKLFSVDSLASLFGRSAPWKGERLQRPHSGAILMLLALFIPIILGGIKYSQYRFSKKVPPLENIAKKELYKECAKEAALAVAQKWNPAKTLANQENNPLQIARNVYDSHPCFQKTALGASVPGLSENGVSLAPSMLKSTDPNSSNTPRVKVEVESDKIKVTTDNQTAYAVPAQCNVDVVFAIPVNSDVSSTALSQITDACKTFVSDHFCYTRGVYASIVPYSGKLSIPSSRSGWAVAFPQYSGSGSTVKLSDLYATIKGNGEALAQSYSWNGTAVMHRKNNNLFSNDNPNEDSRRYLKMNLNPCYASPQSSKCEHACRGYSANTSCIVEPMTDMTAFCNNLGGLSINSGDSYNKSNFVFMALEWANNMFQTWTAGSTAVDASSDNFSYPAKGGGKKAIILIVNKAENFEPAELTYLGFKNDASEVLRESDVIDFSKQYGDASSTFSDGTPHTTDIMGAKQLLHFVSENNAVQRDATSGYYQTTETSSCYLQMPQKHFIKIVVEPVNDTPVFSNNSSNLNSIIGGDAYSYGTLGVGPVGDKQVMIGRNYSGPLAYSQNGTSWTKISHGSMGGANCLPLIYGNGMWVTGRHADSDNLCHSPSLHEGDQANVFTIVSNSAMSSSQTMNFGHGIFMLLANRDSGGIRYSPAYISSDGRTWTKKGECAGGICGLAYGNGMWLRSDGNKSIDDGQTWSRAGSAPSNAFGLTFARGFFYLCTKDGAIFRSKDGAEWDSVGSSFGCSGNEYYNITYYADKLFVTGKKAQCCHIGTFPESYIKFTNLGAGAVTNNNTYNLKGRQEFYIESGQISSTKVGEKYQVKFDVKNVRFISAEMTDKMYKKAGAECSIEGTEDAPYIETNAMRELSVKVKNSVTTKKTIMVDQEKKIPKEVTKYEASATVGGVLHIFSEDEIKNKTEHKFELGEKNSNVSYTLKNADISEANLTVTTTTSATSAEKTVKTDNRDSVTLKFEYVCQKNGSNPPYEIDVPPGTTGLEIRVTSGTRQLVLEEVNISGTKAKYLIRPGDGGSGNVGYAIVAHYTVPGGSSTSTQNPKCNGSQIEISEKGTLVVKVKPNNNATYTVTEYDTEIIKVPVEVDDTREYTDTMLIDPIRYDYQKQSNGTYRIYLPLKKSQLSDFRLTDTSPVFTFTDSVAPSIGSENTVLSSYTGTSKTLEGVTTDACEKLKDDGVRIYTIGYGTPPSTYLSNCATASGGKSFSANDAAELRQRLDEIAADIKSTGFANASEAAVVR